VFFQIITLQKVAQIVVRMVDGRIVDILRDRQSIDMLSRMHDRLTGMSQGTSARQKPVGAVA
jgi:hypothetical protein